MKNDKKRKNRLPGAPEAGSDATGQKQAVDAAERKEADEELRRFAEEVSDLYNNAPCGYHSLDKDGVFIRINDTELSWLGYSRDEIIGKKFSDILTGKSLEVFKENFPLFKERGWVRDLEFDLIRKDGSTISVLLSSTSIRDSAGSYVMSRSTLHDITDRKRTERALRQSEERFRSLVETTSDWIWEVDVNGIYTYASPKIKELLGYEPHDVIGKTPFDLMPHDEAQRILAKFSAIVEARSPFYGLENINLHKDGGMVILETSGVPLFDSNGIFCGYRGIDRDITDRKKTEEELHLHGEIVDNMAEGVILVRAGDGKIVYANSAIGRLFGYDPGELTGKHVSIVNAPTDKSPEETTNEIIKILREKGIWAGEIINIRKDGTPFWCYAVVSTFEHHVHGTVWISIHQDITGRKQAEAEREKLILELQDALAKVRKLSGFLPICASCKKIRDDQGYWNQIEAYIRDHSEAEFTHSLCPDCTRKMYPEFYKKTPEQENQ